MRLAILLVLVAALAVAVWLLFRVSQKQAGRGPAHETWMEEGKDDGGDDSGGDDADVDDD